jgi:hypothetical protein
MSLDITPFLTEMDPGKPENIVAQWFTGEIRQVDFHIWQYCGTVKKSQQDLVS